MLPLNDQNLICDNIKILQVVSATSFLRLLLPILLSQMVLDLIPHFIQRYTAWKHHSMFLGLLALWTICWSFVHESKGLPFSSSAARRRSSKVGTVNTLLDKVMQVSTNASVTCQGFRAWVWIAENRQRTWIPEVHGVSESQINIQLRSLHNEVLVTWPTPPKKNKGLLIVICRFVVLCKFCAECFCT